VCGCGGGGKFGAEAYLETSSKKTKKKVTNRALRWRDDVMKTGGWNWLRVVFKGSAGSCDL
jgi:hypothetical protein